MKQVTINMVKHWLGESVLQAWSGMETLDYRNGICLLDSTLSRLDPYSLYIGTPEVFLQLMDADCLGQEGAFVVTSEGTFIPEPLPQNLTLVQTTLPMTALYNRIHEYVHRYSRWASRLQQTVLENAGLQELLTVAAEELPTTIMITNPGYKHIAAIYYPGIEDDVSRELKDNGYHSHETIQRIHNEVPLRSDRDRSVIEYISSVSGLYNIVYLVRYKGMVLARMAVMLSGTDPNPCYRDLASILFESVSKVMLSSQGADYSSNAALGSLVADLIECRLYDPEELDQRLKQVQLSLRRYYHPILVRINNPGDQGLFPWNYIMAQLQQAFRYCDATTYRGDILLLARKTQRGSRPLFNQQRLQQILEQYDGRAVIGNASEYLSSLAPLYHQIRGVMRIATRMDPQQRIYYFEEYSIFQIIEMAAESEQHHLSSRNLAHLCNNELIALVLYDKKYGTNMTEILFTYLVNERNTTFTAKALYMHRNTLLYKIRKIEEIIGCNLDEPMLRERLLFSYRVRTYMNKYLDDDILKLRRLSNPDAPEKAK